MDDGKLIDLFWQRSEDALIECSIKYKSYCFRIASNILFNYADVEECFNDALLIIYVLDYVRFILYHLCVHWIQIIPVVFRI